MRTLDQLAKDLRTYWLRDMAATTVADYGVNSTGSISVGKTIFIPNSGGFVGINQLPTEPYVLDVLGHQRLAGHLYPYAGNQWTIGVEDQPWSMVYASELTVGTLVSESTIASIGGRILVGPRATLILALTSIATTIDVSTNAFASGDRIYMEKGSAIEWMAVTSSGTAITGGYRFSVTRNLDGGGANTWAAGDTILNTGTTGNGFLDIYSRYGIPGTSETSTTRKGPTISGIVRTGTAWDAISTRWAVGNLYGLYDYGSTDKYGLAAGQQTAAWFSVDETNGIRLMNGSTMLGQWSAAGGITVGQVAASKSNVAIDAGQIAIRTNTTERIVLTAAGVLAINDSDGRAVFTFNASTGAEFTLPLTLGVNGGIYQGSGTFATPTTGLKIWNPTGGATDGGKIAGYNGGAIQWYANTDGKLYAGGGDVWLDTNGLAMLNSISSAPTTNAIRWVNSGGDTLFKESTYLSAGVGHFHLAQMSPPAANDAYWSQVVDRATGQSTYMLLRAVGNTSTAQIILRGFDASQATTALYGLVSLETAVAHYLRGSLGFYGATSGTATLQAAADASTPTLTLPTSTGTLALTSDLTTAVSGTSGYLAKFTAANTIGNSILSESGTVLTLAGSLTLSGTVRKIVGDMSDATLANRLRFSPSTTNANAFLQVVPDGTGNIGIARVYGGSDPDNAPFGQINCTVASGYVYIASNKTGTGTTLPMAFTIGGLTAMVLSLNRALWIGRTSASVLTDAVGMVEVEGSVSVKTSTVHIASAAPGSPLAGESWQDSTQKALSSRQAGITQNLVGTIFTATADQNINTTAAETTLFASGVGTLTLPANFWTIGKTIRVTMKGYWSQTGSSPTRTLRVKAGAVTVISKALTVFGGAVTNMAWAVDVLITARTLGGSGTLMAQGVATLEGNGSYGTATTATATVDTTASAALDVTWQFGTSDANNKVVVTNATVEVLN